MKCMIARTATHHCLTKCSEVDMNYSIRVEYRDGQVTTFDRKSNIKPINAHKLNDKLFHELDGWDTIREITSTPKL